MKSKILKIIFLYGTIKPIELFTEVYMIRIGICDDLISDIEKMQAHIERYAKETSFAAEVKAFSTNDEIIGAIENANEYDLLFVDIYMEALNGVDLVRKIKKSGVQSRVIFFSTSKEHGVDAFSVNAIQYLIKPVNYEDFKNAMDIALIDKAHSEEYIKVFVGNEIITLKLNNIIYSETQRNYQYIYTADGNLIKTRMSCTKLCEMLAVNHKFAKLGASFIINLDYVTSISSDYVCLKEGKKISVPRDAFSPFKQRYIDFYMKDGAL